MTSKSKKQPTGISYQFSRLFQRITTLSPSTLVLTIIGVAYSVFLFAGGLYTLIIKPATAYLGSTQIYFLYPSISGQFVSDTIIACILYAFGFAGLLAIYQSTKSAYKPRQAYMLLIIGVTFLLLSYIFLEGAINFKANGGG